MILFVGIFPQDGNAASVAAAVKIAEMQQAFGKHHNQVKSVDMTENGERVTKIWLMTIDEITTHNWL